MIKFLAYDKQTGAPLYGFGLSDRKIDLLREGKPFLVKLCDMDPSLRGEILIFHGATE